ncbi:MAG: class I SAM-dependent methyltransferase [Desulfarculaceae bacterium]|nr:class I SAM-dependent methyltransferase [Desulfarculaceae bacterium]MCF8073857.1 class I SAM-dependent methyltransferase [Desulfarculaceae bacterium]MCF8102837.1 class I SAM-dependent methyltransferase [Desulfarculaceae bacterium]MCF8116281.1 class I SAM-dependent methyltransferase [Desulfarculaceae bacterium]
MATLHALPDPAPASRPQGPQWWARRWDESRAASPWQSSQDQSPALWQEFYGQVSRWWQQMSGHGEAFGRAAADCLIEEGLLWPGASALDVGCGPGALSLAFGARGARVTALDDSAAMLTRFKASALAAGCPAPRCHCLDWRDHAPQAPYDLVSAAFFPQALCAEGLERLEDWSNGACALILGAGGEVFPFRGEIIRQLLPSSSARPHGHLDLARNYLLASGREPRLRRVSWPVRLDMPRQEVDEYFRAYLAVFGLGGPRVERVVARALEPHTRAGRVQTQAMGQADLLWWPVGQNSALFQAAAS